MSGDAGRASDSDYHVASDIARDLDADLGVGVPDGGVSAG